MYYGKKKAIIISILIVLLVIVLAVGGLFLFTATDLFKSNETLFLKYAFDQYEQLKSNTVNTQLEDIANTKKQTPYETNAIVTLNYEDENGENVEELEDTEINIITREDKINEKQYANLKVNYDDSDLIDIHYAKSNNIYALKWEEIILKYFVGIENENLKELAEKMGFEDVENIPDEIRAIDYSEILELTQQEKEHIIGTYSQVLLNNISEEKYTKQKDMAITKNGVNYNTTAYRLDLSEEEIRNIQIKILETLKQDSITLNLLTTKAKLMSLPEEYTTINGFTNKIEETITQINSEVIDNSKGLSIVVYEYEGKAIQTEIILKNEMKLTITCDVNNNIKTNNIQIYNLSENEEYSIINIKMETTQANNGTNIDIDVNIDDEQNLSISISNIGLASIGNVQTTMTISAVNEDLESITINYNAQTTYGELTVEIIDLDKTNCVILNNYSSKNLSGLINAITQRVTYVLEQKTENEETINENQNTTTQENETNEQE